MQNTIRAAVMAVFFTQTSAADEAQLYRLFNPTFQELQSEYVFGDIHNYVGLSEATIDRALDEQFERIQFMSFSDKLKEDCQ